MVRSSNTARKRSPGCKAQLRPIPRHLNSQSGRRRARVGLLWKGPLRLFSKGLRVKQIIRTKHTKAMKTLLRSLNGSRFGENWILTMAIPEMQHQGHSIRRQLEGQSSRRPVGLLSKVYTLRVKENSKVYTIRVKQNYRVRGTSAMRTLLRSLSGMGRPQPPPSLPIQLIPENDKLRLELEDCRAESRRIVVLLVDIHSLQQAIEDPVYTADELSSDLRGNDQASQDFGGNGLRFGSNAQVRYLQQASSVLQTSIQSLPANRDMIGRKKACFPVGHRLVSNGEADDEAEAMPRSRSSSPISAHAHPTPSHHLMRRSRSSSPQAPTRPTKSRHAAVKKVEAGMHAALERSTGTWDMQESVLPTPQQHVPVPAQKLKRDGAPPASTIASNPVDAAVLVAENDKLRLELEGCRAANGRIVDERDALRQQNEMLLAEIHSLQQVSSVLQTSIQSLQQTSSVLWTSGVQIYGDFVPVRELIGKLLAKIRSVQQASCEASEEMARWQQAHSTPVKSLAGNALSTGMKSSKSLRGHTSDPRMKSPSQRPLSVQTHKKRDDILAKQWSWIEQRATNVDARRQWEVLTKIRSHWVKRSMSRAFAAWWVHHLL